MPLDDVYIHFQYARQIAQGQPYVYNDGQPPTSGATSFLYPFWLAFGYRLGFTGLNLALWALISGAGALALTALASWRYLAHHQPKPLQRLLTLALILTTGSLLWHYVSGMETGILLALMLLTLWSFATRRPRYFAIFAVLLALTRPEGSIMALIVSFVALVTYRRNIIAYALPMLAPLIQPAVNALITGTWVASGNQSKSILAMIPPDTNVMIGRIAENITNITLELFTGYSPINGWYTVPLVGLLGFVGVLMCLRSANTRPVAIVILLWGVAVTLAVATLDNAFWHFKRYQMPLYLLLILHASLPIFWLLDKISSREQTTRPEHSLALYSPTAFLIVISLVITLPAFIDYHQRNTYYVYEQPYQMARWLRDNTPADAVIAVHDVGLMRYYGERTTLDKVGLTTPQAAAYWRNGVGSVGEFLISQRPDFIASYGMGHGYGLALLADTSLYAEILATFTVADWRPYANVALASPTQGIYRPDWTHAEIPPSDNVIGFINVANLTSEATADYVWHNDAPITGFATEFHELERYNCLFDSCIWMAGIRRINSAESFNLPTSPTTQAVWLRTHLHPTHAGQIDIYLADTLIATRWIPEMRGRWFTLETHIPATDARQIRIVPRFNDARATYNPARHEFFTAPPPILLPPIPDAPTFAGDVLQLTDHTLTLTRTALTLDLTWRVLTPPSGDYRFFAHIIADRDQPPIAQSDTYLGGQPVGNWQIGEKHDTIVVDLQAIAQGTYEVAIGFYNPRTGERLPLTSADDDRLFLTTLEIP